MTTGRRSATVALPCAALGVVAALAGAGPSAADERVVRIDRDGVRPQVLQVEPGDTVRFVNEDPTFAYRAQSTGGPWQFDSGPTALLEGDFVVPSALTSPGSYRYRVAQDTPFTGSVVVTGSAPPSAVPSTAPAAPPVAAPSGSPTAAPFAAPAVPGPLPGPRSDRALGLALTVAVVLLVGAASLLLRLLLALPPVPQRPARP